jgi:hypothetical protein
MSHDNSENLVVGDRVRVISEGVVMKHLPKVSSIMFLKLTTVFRLLKNVVSLFLVQRWANRYGNGWRNQIPYSDIKRRS